MHTTKHTAHHLPDLSSLKHEVIQWYRTHAHTLVRVLRTSGAVTGVFTLLNVGIAVAQHGKVGLFTTINGTSYSLMSLDEAARILEEQHAQNTLILNLEGKNITLEAKAAGVSLKTEDTFSAVTEKKGLDRLPLFSVISNLFTDAKPVYAVDQEALAVQLAPFIKDEFVPAQNASVVIPVDVNQPIVVTPEAEGYELNAAVAAQQAAQAVGRDTFTAKVNKRALYPEWSAREVEAYMPAIEAARRMTISIESGEKKLSLTGEKLAAMLELDTTGSTLKTTLDNASLQAFLKAEAKLFYEAPVATRVVLQDGVEISRKEGMPGKQLDTEVTAALVTGAFEQGLQNLEPVLIAIQPDSVFSRTYTNSDKGLYKLIEDFAASHAGSYSVAAVELKGSGNRSAFYAADKPTVPASTFKVFVAYGILQRIEAGTLSKESATSRGSVDYCMNRMIIVSDNDCAIAFQDILGWKAFDTKLASDGFTATRLNNWGGGNKSSTARDEANLLSKLYFSELVTADSSSYLFGLMKQQIYRQGIMAGSGGAPVAAKVGFLDGWYHDMGIVYAPKSTYALVIFTTGAGGFSNIRALSQQIYDFYNQ